MAYGDPLSINDSVGARSYTRLQQSGDTATYIDAASTSSDQRMLTIKANQRVSNGVTRKFRQVSFVQALPDSTGVLRNVTWTLTVQYDDVAAITKAIADNASQLPKNFINTAANQTKMWNGEL